MRRQGRSRPAHSLAGRSGSRIGRPDLLNRAPRRSYLRRADLCSLVVQDQYPDSLEAARCRQLGRDYGRVSFRGFIASQFLSLVVQVDLGRMKEIAHEQAFGTPAVPAILHGDDRWIGAAGTMRADQSRE